MALWNVKDLVAPPNQTYETTLHVVNTVKLASICREAITVLNDQKELHKEAAMLSRLLYRMKTKFRNDKGLKFMTKVNRGLLNYLSMSFARMYSLLEPSPPELGTRAVVAPSRQVMEWVLLRTQGFASLMCNVAQNCEDAAFYMKCRMNLGHVWEIALLSLAILSRVWAISKYLALCACKWYDELRSFVDILKPVGVAWLPQGYQLPENLKTWLSSPILDMDTTPTLRERITGKNKEMDKIFTLIDVEDENNNSADGESNNTQAEDVSENVTTLSSAATVTKKHKHLNISSEDLGEPVDLQDIQLLKEREVNDSMEVNILPKKKKKKDKVTVQEEPMDSKLMHIKCLQSAADVKKFLRREEKLREMGSSKCVTHGFDKLQWHMLTNAVNDILKKLKKVETDTEQYQRLMKKARKELKLRIV